jgi:hypothetical protein
MKLKLLMVVLMSTVVTACASAPLKAPCDLQGHYCGTKTNINQW